MLTVDDILKQERAIEQEKKDLSIYGDRAKEIMTAFIKEEIPRSHCHRWLRKAGIKFSDYDFFEEWKKLLDAEKD